MPQRLALFLLVILIAACTGPGTGPDGGHDPGGHEPDEGDAGLSGVTRFSHTEKEARQFVRRFESLSVGLVNYIDPTRTELISREFSAESVIFRLDSTGDTGPLWTAANDRAAEMTDDYGWPAAELINEYAPDGHMALVKLESIGIPAGARTGDLIPVRITLAGNATDIRGGYVYKTPLRNRQGRTIAMLKQGYLPMAPEKAVTAEQKQEAALLERRDSGGKAAFIYRAGVQLVANVGAGELTADKIVMPLSREIEPGKGEFKRTLSAELVPQVLPQIEKAMKDLGTPCQAVYDANNIVVTPLGVRELTLRQVFERIQSLRVTITPRSNVVIIFDDAVMRIALYGPAQHRMLIRDFALTVDPFTRNKPGVKPQPLHFRVSCQIVSRAEPGKSGRYGIPNAEEAKAGLTPDGNLGQVRLSWSRWNRDGDRAAEGTDTLNSTDLSDVLRFLWTRGMNPAEALGFVLEANDALALACELGFNWRKLDINRLATEGTGDAPSGDGRND